MKENRLIIRSKENSVNIISDYLSNLFENKISAKDDNAIHLAVEEAVVNITTHGFKNSDGKIEVLCKIVEPFVIIHICDNAPAFNPLLLPSPDIEADLENRQIGGLGVHLIKSLMDEVEYRKTENGNHLTLKKRLTPV